MTKATIATMRYEDSAEQATVTGWVCKTCRRFWGSDEHMARWCCAADLPCECGGRVKKSYTRCDECRRKAEDKKWFARERRQWDGEPLFSDALDRYFFDEDDVRDAIHDNGGDWESLRFVICDPQYAREIDDDYFCDDLPEDSTLDDANGDLADAVEALNAVIRQQRKDGRALSWLPGKYAAIIDVQEASSPERGLSQTGKP